MENYNRFNLLHRYNGELLVKGKYNRIPLLYTKGGAVFIIIHVFIFSVMFCSRKITVQLNALSFKHE